VFDVTSSATFTPDAFTPPPGAVTDVNRPAKLYPYNVTFPNASDADINWPAGSHPNDCDPAPDKP
jgi:hypothetical protein